MKNLIDRNLKLEGKVVLLLFFAILGLLQPSVASAAWNISTIDSAAIVDHNSIAIDSNNKVHISYCVFNNNNTDSDLKYATNASGSWFTSTIDSTGVAGWYNSIAIDSNNKVHISYFNYSQGVLKYATNASGSWVITVVDYDPNFRPVGKYTSIAIDSNNKVHILYKDDRLIPGYPWDATWLKHATNASGVWTTEELGGGWNRQVGYHNSIAIDSNNKLHISFYDYTYYEVRYATNASGSWLGDSIYGPFGGDGDMYDTSIAIDSNNKAHISYSAGYPNNNLMYRTNTSGSWSTPITIDGPWSASVAAVRTSIAIDSNNKAHISYNDPITNSLKYATNISGTWNITPIGPINGRENSIALDSNNNAHISYQGSLKYATNASPITCIDNDLDGYGNPGNASCPKGSATDCNDNDGTVNPGATEGPYGNSTCTDGKDNDCDGFIDAGDSGCTPPPTDWVFNPATGSSYKFIDCGTWTACKTMAASLGAKLVTINTAAEQSWLVSTFGGTELYWIGFADNTTEGVWKWTNGETPGYTNWAPTQPDNGWSCGEDYGEMNFGAPGKWNDLGTCSPDWSWVTKAIIEKSCIDLDITALSTTPAATYPGAVISITDTTKNIGTCTAPATITKLYLSTNTTLDAADTLLGQRAVPSLGAAATSTGSTSATIPSNTAIATYYIIAKADADEVFTEVNNTNNKMNKSIKIGPDLTVTSMTTTPTAPVAGQNITVKVNVKNIGGGAAGGFYVDIYKNLATKPAPYQVGDAYCWISGLAVGTTTTCTQTVSYATAGTYKMWAQVDTDQQVAEANETNNTKSKSITVAP